MKAINQALNTSQTDINIYSAMGNTDKLKIETGVSSAKKNSPEGVADMAGFGDPGLAVRAYNNAVLHKLED